MSLRQISRGIVRLQPVEHRLQLIPKPGGITIIDDAFNSNSADYQTDKSLEAIIKKGPDNDLGFGGTDAAMNEELNEFDNTQQETYQSGHNFSDLFGGGQNH